VFACKLPTDKLSPDKPPDVLKSPSTEIPPSTVRFVPSQERFAVPLRFPPGPAYTIAWFGISETLAAPKVAPPVAKSNTTSLNVGPY